ncbi:MAG: histidine kinase [Alphaproteobacteria bacterium]|nr:histidine kinase [Alphaproteobacteria bacterium]
MIPFRYAHAAGTNARRLVDACAARLAPVGDEPPGGLGFLYVSDQLANELPEILTRLKVLTGTADWVGSVGAGICATGQEYYGVPGIAAMIADIAPADYHLVETVREDLSGFKSRHEDWRLKSGSRFGIVHADPRNNNVPDIVEGIATAIDGFLVGGISSSRRHPLQIAGDITMGGVSGVLLSDNVSVATALSQSCSLIGTKHLITRANGNIIHELDGRPALTVFKEEIGDLLARDLKRIEGFIFVAAPVRGSDTGDYMVRHIVGIDQPNELIAISENVSAGRSIQFCRRDAPAAEEDLVRMIVGLKQRANTPPRGAVYFSCVARGPNLFGTESRELKLIKRELGDVPLVGFFCYGEISNDRLYGYTGVLTLFL